MYPSNTYPQLPRDRRSQRGAWQRDQHDQLAANGARWSLPPQPAVTLAHSSPLQVCHTGVCRMLPQSLPSTAVASAVQATSARPGWAVRSRTALSSPLDDSARRGMQHLDRRRAACWCQPRTCRASRMSWPAYSTRAARATMALAEDTPAPPVHPVSAPKPSGMHNNNLNIMGSTAAAAMNASMLIRCSSRFSSSRFSSSRISSSRISSSRISSSRISSSRISSSRISSSRFSSRRFSSRRFSSRRQQPPPAPPLQQLPLQQPLPQQP